MPREIDFFGVLLPGVLPLFLVSLLLQVAPREEVGAYVDEWLDHINISLDNGLFGGKYWLPNEQSVEIRRQIPELDFAAGAVIKGRMRIASYTFNEPIPDSVFYGRPVSAHFQLIHMASAVVSSTSTSGWKRMPPLHGPRARS